MIRNYQYLFFLASAIALGALAAWPARATAPTVGQLANMLYTGIFEHPVTLKNGHWEGDPFMAGGSSRPAVGLVEDFLLTGDLDGDANDEAVVLLWESSGGLGNYDYLAVVGMRDEKPFNLGTALIGDRIQVRAGRIAGNRIELDVVEPGPDDAACCPSQKATRSWTLDATGLHVNPPRLTGILSLSDLAGVEWLLVRLVRNKPLAGQPEITLVFEGDRLSGKSACNRYFATVKPADKRAGELLVSDIGSTRMACPEEVMKLENRYLEALQNATRYGFVAGKLALTFQKDGVTDSLLFVPRKPPRP